MNNLLTDKTKEAFERWIHLKEQYFDYAIENDDATVIPSIYE